MAAGSAPPGGPTALPRRLGFWETTLIVIGVTIGSGIFRVPASVADTVGSPAGVATVWVAVGSHPSLPGILHHFGYFPTRLPTGLANHNEFVRLVQ